MSYDTYVWYHNKAWRLESYLKDHTGRVSLQHLRDHSLSVFADEKDIRPVDEETARAITQALLEEAISKCGDNQESE